MALLIILMTVRFISLSANCFRNGIDKDEIYRKVYNTYSEGRLRLMGYVLYDKMQVFPQFNSALVWLTKEEQSKFQYVKGDTEGFVNIPLSIKNIIFSVFFA